VDTRSSSHADGAVAPAPAPADVHMVSGEDEDVAPITHVHSGIDPVANFLPDTSAASTELPVTETVPPQVEQPISNVRSEPQLSSNLALVEESTPLDTSMEEAAATEESAPVVENSAASHKISIAVEEANVSLLCAAFIARQQ
jgi:hypothetical protein